MTDELREGWYLMSTADLERELARRRGSDADLPPSNARPLEIEEALAFRDGGNLPDELDRTLRLVLLIEDAAQLDRLEAKRMRYEPDFLDQPTWRKAGSKPVNVLPLRVKEISPGARGPWWEDDRMAELEAEWRRAGTAGGVRVPGEYRGFVFRTVAALWSAGRPVTVESIVGSIARWVSDEDAATIGEALRAANEEPRG
ncbi:MAG: hypothetical protein ACRDKZ_12985 [Actinomycetota bacterium]